MYNDRQKKILYILVCICIFLVISLIMRLTIVPNEKRDKGQLTVLLNPKYLLTLEELTISDVSGSIRLFKKNGIWFGTDGTLRFPANDKIITELIKSLTEKRMLYHVTDTVSLRKSYGLEEESAVSIIAKNEDGSIATELYFGNENSTALRIALSTGKKLGIYQTENNIYQFLHTEARFWADMLIFPEKIASFLPQNVVRCMIDGKDATDNAYIEILRSARCSAIINPSLFVGQKPLHTITVETVQKNLMVLLYRYGESFAVILGDTAQAGYALEISAWTYNRILPQLEEK